MSTRESADLLIEPRWLLPIAPANTVLEQHAVAVCAGRIAAVGPAAQLRARFQPREHVVRARHALLPGLVNAHARSCHALLRSLPVRGPRLRWLAEVLGPLEERAMSADFVRDGTRFAVGEMLRAGISCFADLSAHPEQAARAAAPLRAAIGLPVGDAPTAWAENATAHLERAEALWDEYRADPRISLYFAPLPRPALSDATLARVRRVADELDARIALPLPELSAAPASATCGVADAAAEPPVGYGGRALGRLAAQGLLRPGFTAIGAAGLRREEFELLSRHGATLVACPQAELRLGATPAPLPLLPEDRTGLGTDSALAAGALDVLAETRAAALLSNLPAAEALRLATLGGATALGLTGEIGSIEPGKAADLTCLDLADCSGAALGRVADAIVFAATRSAVSDVWCAGRAALSGGQLMGFDAGELAALPLLWAQRLGVAAAA
jgi:5-methylthioadenosine/S-adenosylhomocysteine deaminase